MLAVIVHDSMAMLQHPPLMHSLSRPDSQHIAEMSRICLVLFEMNSRIFGPLGYLVAIRRIIVSVLGYALLVAPNRIRLKVVQYKSLRRKLVQQASIQDSLLESTATDDAASVSTLSESMASFADAWQSDREGWETPAAVFGGLAGTAALAALRRRLRRLRARKQSAVVHIEPALTASDKA
jgi:hypothetical protein